jgi:hypothetical protein
VALSTTLVWSIIIISSYYAIVSSSGKARAR